MQVANCASRVVSIICYWDRLLTCKKPSLPCHSNSGFKKTNVTTMSASIKLMKPLKSGGKSDDSTPVHLLLWAQNKTGFARHGHGLYAGSIPQLSQMLGQLSANLACWQKWEQQHHLVSLHPIVQRAPESKFQVKTLHLTVKTRMYFKQKLQHLKNKFYSYYSKCLKSHHSAQCMGFGTGSVEVLCYTQICPEMPHY